MPTLNTHTAEGYSYISKPSFLGYVWLYVKNQFVWPDVFRWRGSTLLPTLPGIIITTGFSCLVCLFNLTFKVDISIPVSVLGTVSVALGLLLAFRVNTAYDRYWEGRKLIQSVMGTIRNLARQVWINIPENNEDDHIEKMRCVKLLLAYFVATKRHLRHEYGTNYYDLKTLLPPGWKPVSAARAKQLKDLEGHTSSHFNVQLSNDSGSGIKRSHISFSERLPALTLSLTDAIKPKTYDYYLDSDEPTDIANIRRSLIEQEFPGSSVARASTAYLKRAANGVDLNNHNNEERFVPELDIPQSSTGIDKIKNFISGKVEESHIRERFHKQNRKYINRQQDHSKFTSEEDLPYQGDADLSLPLEILFRIALYINQVKAQGKIEAPLVSSTTASLDTLANALTSFERIIYTPIPKAYNIHLKQAVVLYVFFLPFALVESLGWIAVPIVALASFTLYGIEAIGSEIENPFGYDDNDLPLNQYCDELKKEVEYIIYHIPTHSNSILLDGK
ncbi:hypothetical protein K501DRAFT_249738 [Backusella circina FSU 941]|nr:hypothetical protein K501DRAFT_249738 [Backusella circina FSU 941]